MVRVYHNPPPVRKGSIDFLLNSTPASSFDCKNLSAFLPNAHALPQPAPPAAGVDQLLTAASLLGKRSIASASSSEATTPSRPQRPELAAHEVVQQVTPKKRKRKEIQCKECGRTFGDSSSARKHHRVVHLKIKEFKCEECGKSFAEKSNRSKHYIAAHLNQRSHPCPDCDKVFNFTDGLRRHRNNVHLGLRPYPCEDCNTSYKQKTHLLKHRQSVHGIPFPPKGKN